MTLRKPSNSSRRIALLPLGATEQHGPHLPLETDAIIAGAIAARAADALGDELDIELLPVEEVGYSIEHGDARGTKTLSFEEATARWIGIGEEVHRRGIEKFVMLNAHGGNSPLMTVVATELRVRRNMLAVATSWTRFGYPEDVVSAHERAFGIHGGLIETSVMLALRPELVDMGKARDFPSAQERFAARVHAPARLRAARLRLDDARPVAGRCRGQRGRRHGRGRRAYPGARGQRRGRAAARRRPLRHGAAASMT